jgi:hypothetical protein
VDVDRINFLVAAEFLVDDFFKTGGDILISTPSFKRFN